MMTRKTKIIWTVAGVVVITTGVMAFFAAIKLLGLVEMPAGSEKQGNFESRHRKREGFGHTDITTSLYYKGRLLTTRLNGFAPDPNDTERVLYEAFCGDYGTPAPDCGLFYLEGHSGRTFRLSSNPNVSLVSLDPQYGEESHHPWSSDGKFLVLDGYSYDNETLLLLDLQSGESYNLAKSLNSAQKYDSLSFQGWSPDGRLAAFLADTSIDPASQRQLDFVTDLYQLDVQSLTATYACTAGPYEFAHWDRTKDGTDSELHGTTLGLEWRKEGDGYRMAMWAKDKPNAACKADPQKSAIGVLRFAASR